MWEFFLIFSTCLTSPLSTAPTTEHVSDPVKGLCTFLPRLMSESSQGSAISSRGGVNGTRGGAGKLAYFTSYWIPYVVLWMKWSECSFNWIITSIFLLLVLLNRDNCASVTGIRCAETAVLMAKAHTSYYMWGRCTRDSSVSYSKENIPQSRMTVINNKWELQIIDRGWHD